MASFTMRRGPVAVAVVLAAVAWALLAAPAHADTPSASPTPSPQPTQSSAELEGHLTLTATVSGGSASAADWQLSAADATSPDTSVGPASSGDPAVTAASVPADPYDLTSVPTHSGGPWDDYTAAWSCTGGTLDDAQVQVDSGADVHCTVTFTYTPPRLTLKIAVAGGPTDAGDWTLTASGPQVASGQSGSASVTRTPVTSGSYALSAAVGAGSEPAGYQASWQCDGATLTNGAVQLAAGADASCTVTESWQRAVLTLATTLAPPPGREQLGAGPGAAGDWVLTADGPVVMTGRSGAQLEVPSGSYHLAQSGTAPNDQQYVLAGWSCLDDATAKGVAVAGDSVAVPAGRSTTCTATEEWRGPQAAAQSAPTAQPTSHSGTPTASATPTPAPGTASGPASGTPGAGGGGSPSDSSRSSDESSSSADATPTAFQRGVRTLVGYGAVILVCALVALYFAWQRRRARDGS